MSCIAVSVHALMWEYNNERSRFEPFSSGTFSLIGKVVKQINTTFVKYSKQVGSRVSTLELSLTPLLSDHTSNPSANHINSIFTKHLEFDHISPPILLAPCPRPWSPLTWITLVTSCLVSMPPPLSPTVYSPQSIQVDSGETKVRSCC